MTARNRRPINKGLRNLRWFERYGPVKTIKCENKEKPCSNEFDFKHSHFWRVSEEILCGDCIATRISLRNNPIRQKWFIEKYGQNYIRVGDWELRCRQDGTIEIADNCGCEESPFTVVNVKRPRDLFQFIRLLSPPKKESNA